MKAYEKPKLYAESFVLVEHISTNCSPDITSMATYHNLGEGCGVDINGGGDIVFATETNCAFHQDPSAVDPNPSMSEICYQGLFIANAQAFSS